MKTICIICAALMFASGSALAVEYECTIDRKWDTDGPHTKERIKEYRFSVRIEETPEITILSRCSYSPSERRESCDRYTVDHTAFDTSASIKKYYVFRSHFDVQLFSDLTMLENNGRGTVATGKCVVVSP